MQCAFIRMVRGSLMGLVSASWILAGCQATPPVRDYLAVPAQEIARRLGKDAGELSAVGSVGPPADGPHSRQETLAGL